MSCTLKKIIFSLSVLVLFGACNNNRSDLYKKVSGHTMGTSYSIVINTNHNNLKSDIDSILKYTEYLFSTYIDTAQISVLNKSINGTEVSNEFVQLFELSKKVNTKTNGAFDPTLMPLVNYWGFGYQNTISKTDSFAIDSLLSLVGIDKFILNDNYLSKADNKIQLDFSAIAKGYGVDLVAVYLDVLKISNYMIEVGGEILVKGLNSEGEEWKIGIDKPIFDEYKIGRKLAGVIRLSNKSMATSGNYRNYRIVNGNKVGHTLNPQTGYPIQTDILSVSVIANQCALADAYATAFMVLGFKASYNIVEADSILEAIFIIGDQDSSKVIITKNLQNKVIVLNN